MKYSSQLSLLLVTILLVWKALCETSIYDEIYSNPDLKEFSELVDKDPLVKAAIEYNTVTVFAPTNAAILMKDIHYLRNETASYHVTNGILKQELFPISQPSQLSNAAPLYLSVREERPNSNSYDLHRKEYFVNNAKILSDREYTTKNGKKQLLYIIDEQLEPVIPSTQLPPSAFDVIKNFHLYRIDLNWGIFFTKIESTPNEKLYKENGSHTFFVPIDFKPSDILFDDHVIRGHVIPNKVLFIRTMGLKSYPSDAYDGNVNVEVSFINITTRYNNMLSYNIQSNTLKTDGRYNKGVVMSPIVRSNIPVSNGVIHIIRKPLMIIENTNFHFLEEENDGRIDTFYRLIDLFPELKTEIKNLNEKTILAPTDLAFSHLNDENIVDTLVQNPEELKKLLYLHIIPHSVSTDDVIRGSKKDILSYDNRTLSFTVVGNDYNPKLMIQNGGNNAIVIRTDIDAIFGIIHIINRVIEMPSQNIYDKLRTDPDLSFTYELDLNGSLNLYEKLSGIDRYTYFVPSNTAWKRFIRAFPNEYKQIKGNLDPSKTRSFLDRHLFIGLISIKKLEDGTQLITTQGLLTFKRISGYTYPDIEWEGIRARIIRPDIQAVNGVIHVIDTVLMKEINLTNKGLVVSVNSSNINCLNICLLIIALILAKLCKKIRN